MYFYLVKTVGQLFYRMSLIWICLTCLLDGFKLYKPGGTTAEEVLCFQWVVSGAHDVRSVGDADFDHLLQALSAISLHYKVIIFHL